MVSSLRQQSVWLGPVSRKGCRMKQHLWYTGGTPSAARPPAFQFDSCGIHSPGVDLDRVAATPLPDDPLFGSPVGSEQAAE